MKGSKIWGVGKHHLYIDGKPAWVYVSDEALKKDYNILKAKLPIPIGIDHLDPKIIQENKILSKMDLLNVGSIEDVELVDDGIRILEAKITNPLIQELYEQKKLPSWSIVSGVSLNKCESGKVDFVEDYSVINRVDFVEKGACTTCNVEYKEKKLMNAKSMIGDIMAEEGNNSGQEGSENEETTLNDVVKSITDFKEDVGKKLENMDKRIGKIEKKEGTTEGSTEEGGSEGEGTSEGKAKNPELEALQKEIADMKAESAEMQAKGVVEGYVKEGKILPKNIDKHMKLALSDNEAYTDMMAEAPVVVENLGERLSNGEAGNGGSDNENDPVQDLVDRYDKKED